MSSLVCVTGKGGVGKTTLISVLLKNLLGYYPGCSILTIDFDFNSDLAYALGLKFHKTLSSLYENNHMNPLDQESSDCMVADYIVPVQENLDMMTVGDILYQDCRCQNLELLKNSLAKVIQNYDFVILDTCESTQLLKKFIKSYMNTLIVISDTSKSSVISAIHLTNNLKNIFCPEQVGIILNKIRERSIPDYIYSKLKGANIDILGVVPYDEELRQNEYAGLSLWRQNGTGSIQHAFDQILYRLNLPNR